MAEFTYLSKNRLVLKDGVRHAYLGEVPEPVPYGVQGALREYYGAARRWPAGSGDAGPYRGGGGWVNVRHARTGAASTECGI